MNIAISLLLSAALQAAPPGDTLVIALDDAIDRALVGNPNLMAVRAQAQAARQEPLDATRAFLPTVELGLGGVRTTDPVGVFGIKLRQSNFLASDLALDALNNPEPYGGFTSSATVTMPLFVPEGLFGHSAANRMADAREAQARRMEGATVYQVVEAYWSAQFAARQVEALEAAVAAARSHVARAEAMRDQGLVTGLDARLARVRAGAIEARRLGAEAQAANTLDALATLIGIDPSIPLQLTDSLTGPFNTVCVTDSDTCSLDDRADLEAMAFGMAAAEAGVRSAWGKNLPSVALFGSLAHHAQSTPWATGSGDWTVGFLVKWKVFQGLGGVGAVNKAKAEHRAAVAQAEAARSQAALEAQSALRFVNAARQRVAVTTTARNEAIEALAQAELRYQQGQSAITELLDVEAAATSANLNLLATRRDLFVAQAALDFAYGVFDR